MKVVLFANTDWYLYNFRRGLAEALRAKGHEVLLVSPPGPYGTRLRAAGHRWAPVRLDRRGLNPLREAAALRRLVRVFRAEQPDLVHGETIKGAIYGSLAARLAGVPLRVCVVVGLGYVFSSDDLRAQALRPVVRKLLRLALQGPGGRVVVVNNEDAAALRAQMHREAWPVTVVSGNGVDCSRFRPDPSRTRNGRFQVLLPARMLWEKGVAEFVTAARSLQQEGRPIDFLLAGAPDHGNPAAVPEQQLRAWVSEGVVRWLGHVDEMPALYRTVDAAVLPTFYGEGLPTCLIEAGATGLPVVTTDAPGCRDVVADGVDGLLVPPRDATALAQAIARLHDDPDLCTRLGTAARTKAIANFDESLVIDRMIGVYEELAASARVERGR